MKTAPVIAFPAKVWETDAATWKAFYLSTRANAPTIQQYKRMIAGFHQFCPSSIKDVTQEEIHAYLATISEGYGEAMRKKIHNCLFQYWRFAHKIV